MAWSDMTELERLIHSISNGTDYQNKVTDEGLWAQATNALNPGEAPEGISDTIWKQANLGKYGGFNVTSVTRDPAVRDALVDAGFGDWVKGAYEMHMDQHAGHAMGNGADSAGAWDRANQSIATADDWYAQNYGVYGNESLGASNNNTLGFGHESGGNLNNVNVNIDGGGEGPANEGNDMMGLDYSNVGQGEAVVRNRAMGTVDYGERTGPAVNTGIGTAGPAPQNPNQAPRSTPFADSYIRSNEAATKQGPISGLFSKELDS